MRIFNRLLRDTEGFFKDIFDGKNIWSTVFQLFWGCAILFAIYGIVMGLFNSPLQGLSSLVKVPALFLLALIICFPALFVINIILGSKLSMGQSLAMLLSAYGITACVLASFAPIGLFFTLIGSSYAFLRLLHVGIFTIAGLAGMIYLNNGSKQGCEYHAIYPKLGVRVFKIWVIIFAFVGTQLAWNLRPFLGNKEKPFQILRKQESNFYAHIIHTFGVFVRGETKPSKPKSKSSNYRLNVPEDSTRIQDTFNDDFPDRDDNSSDDAISIGDSAATDTINHADTSITGN